jgi:hypothetical protein
MTSLDRLPRALALAASVTLLMAGLALQPVAAISNGSSLIWLGDRQPATASIDETITTEVGKPNGERIKVAILNGSGKRVRQAGIAIRLVIKSGTGNPNAHVSGDSALTDADGVAVFEPSIDTEGFGYKLVARAADRASLNSEHIASVPSAAFDIRDGDVTACSGACSDSDEKGNTKAQVNGDADGYLVFNLGDSGAGCGEADSEILSFDLVGTVNERTLVTIEVLIDRGRLPDDVCLRSDEPFVDKDGETVPAGEAGLLADCDPPVQTNDDPCIEERSGPSVNPVVITFSVDPGDPKVYVK